MMMLQLFWNFLQIGTLSIGGGFVAMPLIQSQIVERMGWLTMNEFSDLVTIAEMTPGPIVVNSATFVGIRIAGIPGAAAATLGCVLPSVVILSVLAWAYRKFQRLSVMQSVLGCLRPAVVALIASAGLSILKNALFAGQPMGIDTVNVLQLVSFLLALAVLRKYKWNPILVMLLCGMVGLLTALPA